MLDRNKDGWTSSTSTQLFWGWVIAWEKLKGNKSPGTDEVIAEFIQTWCQPLHSGHKLTSSIILYIYLLYFLHVAITHIIIWENMYATRMVQIYTSLLQYKKYNNNNNNNNDNNRHVSDEQIEDITLKVHLSSNLYFKAWTKNVHI
jgi:hypothetical protein